MHMLGWFSSDKPKYPTKRESRRGEPWQWVMARRAGREIWWSTRWGDSKAGGAKTDAVLKDDGEVDIRDTWFSQVRK